MILVWVGVDYAWTALAGAEVTMKRIGSLKRIGSFARYVSSRPYGSLRPRYRFGELRKESICRVADTLLTTV
jgi:hypothetical protein